MSPNFYAISTMLRACDERWRNRPRGQFDHSAFTGFLLYCLSAVLVAALVTVACGAVA